MHPSAAIPILQALADGLDPATGQPFPPDSPYQRADTVRALHAALEALRAPAARATGASPHLPATGASPSDPKLPRLSDPDKPAAGQKWTPEEDQRLRDAFAADTHIRDLAAAHGRTRGAIESRLVRLGLVILNHPAPVPASPPTPGPVPASAPAATPSPRNPKHDDAFPF